MNSTAVPRPKSTAASRLNPGRGELPIDLLAGPNLCATAKLVATALVTCWAR